MREIEVNKWRADPTIKAIVAATFPNYKRTKVLISAAEKATLSELNWSGGSRSEYRACTIAGEAAGSTARYNQCAPWRNPAEGMEVPIPPGMILVRGGSFCGKESMLCLYVNPADMPKYLPSS